jgi:hypothetical protein
MNYQPPPAPCKVDWHIELKGRAWTSEEIRSRYDLTPEKIELISGKLLWSNAERLRLLGLLLENCGAEAVVRMGDPEVWRRAIARLNDPEATFRYEIEEAYRRWNEVYEEYPATAIRWYEGLTTADYAEYVAPDATGGTTRDEILADLQVRVEAERSRDPGYSRREDAVEHIRFGQEQGEVQVIRTTEYQRYERTGDNSFRALPSVREVERWYDTWVKSPDGWHLQRRVRIEGPASV